jgi:CHAD domain-containing protein
MGMTPGLARFAAVRADDQEQGWDEVMTAVTASLERSFTVLPDRAASEAAESRTWFDTFDWLLFKAGLILEYVPGRGGSVLRLAPLADDGTPGAISTPGATGAASTSLSPGQPDIIQPVTGWRPTRPHSVGDLPPGALADRVGAIIAPRALLPVAAVSQVSAAVRLLNGDDKTVARLTIQRSTLQAAQSAQAAQLDRMTRELPPRFEIQPVRGYVGQARRAASLLQETEGLAKVSTSVLDEALAACGREPGDYSNKVNAPVAAGMPASQAVAVILLRLLDMAEANISGTLRDIDPEFLHDFRVAVRRSRAALKLFGGALPDIGDLAGIAAEFKWLGDLTTPTRDLDVHLLGFEGMAGRLRAAKPDDLEPFRAYLEDKRVRECRALVRGLRSPRFRDLAGLWRDALAPIAGTSGSPGGPGKPGRPRKVAHGEISAASLAAERTRQAFAKVARRGGAITADSPHESLHDLRKRCKELRYALEFFASVYDPGTFGKVVGDLKKLQDCLGDFQDNEVQIEEIRALAAEMTEAPAVTLLAMGEITAGLAVNQAKARADFERRFAAFAGIEGQRRMSVLLRGGSVAG